MTKAQKTFEKLAFTQEDAAISAGTMLAGGGAIYGGHKAYQKYKDLQKVKTLKRAGGRAGMAAAALGAGYVGFRGLKFLGNGSVNRGARRVANTIPETREALKYYDTVDITATNAYRNAKRSKSPIHKKAKNLLTDLYYNFDLHT